MIPERAALVATLLADRAALAVTAAMVVTLMAAARLVAMVVLEFCLVMAALRAAMGARRSEEMPASEEKLVASEDLAAMVATAAPCWGQSRSAALAAIPIISERAALVATLLADRAVLAVTAATAGTLMAATRLVALAVPDLCSARAETSPT